MGNNGFAVTRNTVFLLFSRVVMALSSLVFFAQAARGLSREEFGALTLAFTYVQILYVVVDFGGGYLIVREVARDKKIAGRAFVSGLVTKLVPLALGNGVLWVLARRMYENPITIAALEWSGLAASFQALAAFFRAFFSAHEEMQFTAMFMAGESLLFLGIGSLIIHAGYGVVALMMAYALVYCLSALASMLTVLYKFRILVEWDFLFVKDFFRQSLPFFLFLVFGILYSRLDTVLLSLLASTREVAVGIYQASFKLIISLDYLPDMLSRSIYPVVSRVFARDREYVVRLCDKSLRYLISVAVPIAFGMFVLADWVLIKIYGVGFAASALVMRFLVWTIPLRYAGFVYGIVLSATDNQRYRAISTATVFAVGVVLDIYMIPRFDYIGVSIVSLVSSMLLFSLYAFFVGKHFARFRIVVYFLQATLGSLIMCGGIRVLRLWRVSELLIIPIAAALYLGFMILMRFIGPEDLLALRRTAAVLVRGGKGAGGEWN